MRHTAIQRKGWFLVSQLWYQLCSPAAGQNCLLWLLAEVIGQALCGMGWGLVLFPLGTQSQEVYSVICTGSISSLNAWGEKNGSTVTTPSLEQQRSWFELCLPPALLPSALLPCLLLHTPWWCELKKPSYIISRKTPSRLPKWCSLFTGWGS